MSMTAEGLTLTAHGYARPTGRFDVPRPAHWSNEVNDAVDEFHERTNFQFSQVQDLLLIADYARHRGWSHIAQVLRQGAGSN